MKAMDGVQEEEGADTFVKVIATPTESVQSSTLLHQFGRGDAGTSGFEGLIALSRVR